MSEHFRHPAQAALRQPPAVILGAGALTGAALLLDDETRDPGFFSRDLRRGLSWAGDSAVVFPAAGLAAAAGRPLPLEALSLAAVETTALKLITRRRRPDGSDRRSFPSLHAANTFTLATLAAHEWGWKAGVPAFLAAALISHSRHEQGAHYLSDTVFGAGLGVAAGLGAVNVHARGGSLTVRF